MRGDLARTGSSSFYGYASVNRVILYELKMISVKIQHSLIAQPSELAGHSASVNAQVIGKLLAVERNIEHGAAVLERLIREV